MMIHLASQNSQSQLSTFEPGDVQPNAIDLRLDTVHSMNEEIFVINEHSKQHRGSTPVETDYEDNYCLQHGVYEIVMQGEITLGENEAGFVITRSTLNRNGLYITSGLYDSGYQGVMAGALHVTQGEAVIKKGTRVGQFLLWKAESLGLYDGDYGKGTEHDEKYQDPTYQDKTDMHYWNAGQHYKFDGKGTLVPDNDKNQLELDLKKDGVN